MTDLADNAALFAVLSRPGFWDAQFGAMPPLVEMAPAYVAFNTHPAGRKFLEILMGTFIAGSSEDVVASSALLRSVIASTYFHGIAAGARAHEVVALERSFITDDGGRG
jgi:hypothetical protein